MRFCILPKQSISMKFRRWRLVSGKEALWLIFLQPFCYDWRAKLAVGSEWMCNDTQHRRFFRLFGVVYPWNSIKTFFGGLNFSPWGISDFFNSTHLEKNHLKKSPCMNSYTNKIYYTPPPFSSPYNGLKNINLKCWFIQNLFLP